MRKDRVDVLESMNVNVAERMPFVDRYIQSFQLDEQCRKLLFPVYTPNPKYDPLELRKLGGVFVFLLSMLCLSLIVLFFEIIASKWYRQEKKMKSEQTTFEIQLYVDQRITHFQRISFTKYMQCVA